MPRCFATWPTAAMATVFKFPDDGVLCFPKKMVVMMKAWNLPILLAVLLMSVPACRNKGPVVPEDLTPVHGVVTLDGKPLAGVVVTFSPDTETGTVAAGITDQNGRFQLASFPTGNGARPGKYKVVVANRGEDTYSHSIKGATPAIYGRLASTPLTATVPTTEEIVLQLKSKLY